MTRICLCLLFAFGAIFQTLFAQGRPTTPFLFSQEVSSPYVTAFAEDPEGYMWIATNHGLNRYNGTYFDVHYAYSYKECMCNDNVTKLMVDEAGDLWMLSEAGLSVRRNGQYYHYGEAGFAPVWQIADIDRDFLIIADNRGVEKINKKDLSIVYSYKSLKVGYPKPIGILSNGGILVTRTINGTDQLVLLDEQLREIGTLSFSKEENVVRMLCDKDGSDWIVAEKSIYHVTSADVEEAFKDFSNQSMFTLDTPFASINQDQKLLFVCNYDKDNLLLGVQNSGMMLLNKNTGQKKPILTSETLPLSKYECYVDSHLNIWLTDGVNGFTVLSSDLQYEHLSFPESNDKNYKTLCFDAKERLWVRSSYDLICYNPETGKHFNFTQKGSFYGDIFFDSKDHFWVIENYNELKCYELREEPVNNVGVKLYIIKHYYLEESAFSLGEDSEGHIWVTLSDRFAVIEQSGEITYQEGPFNVNFTSLRGHGAGKRLFLYTIGKGIYECRENGSFAPIGTQIPNSRIIFDDENHSLWIGSSNNGLVRYNEMTKETEYLLDKMSMEAFDVKAIEKDTWGNIWFSTSTMVFRYNPYDNSVFSIHDDHLNSGYVYNLYSSAIDKHGKLYFGGMDGLTIIDPMTLKTEKKEIPIKLEDVVVGGDSLYEYDGKPFVLPYNRNNIVFWFSGLDFSLGKQLSYEYKLDGHFKDWLPVGMQPRISFAQLPAGNYNLKIRVKAQTASNTFGELSVPFSIKPAPWLTIWAKLAYIIILLTLGFFLFRHLIRWRLRESRYALLQQREAVNSEYVRFVTNISHEFRTPLSMMYAPLVEFLSDKTFVGKDKDLLDLVLRNTERLKSLTERVLDAGKGKHQEKSLSICQQNVVLFFKLVVDNFHYLANEKNISIDFIAPDKIDALIDNEKVGSILSNLLSNSIKYTPEGGNIRVLVEAESGLLKVSVADTGVGVPQEQVDKLFKKYERFGMETKSPKTEGTGIGLYYSYYLAHLHHGDLSYSPNTPHGSIFTLTVPSERVAYKEDKVISIEEMIESVNIPKEIETDNSSEKQGIIFIVEDSRDVCQFLQLCFGKRYDLFFSSNGAEALDNLTSLVPDLIISDVMLPVMNGFELCKKLKQSSTYGHIPVILLTALVGTEQEIEGMKSGADAYVQKPFEPRKFIAKVETMIANRRKVQHMISSLTSSTLPQQQSSQTADEATEQLQMDKLLSLAERNFLQKFYALLDEHLADESFGVENMSRALGIGEAKLYAKVKTLTGQTPKAFFVTYRMNKALELLKSGEFTVSEVGYKVGATSPAVFSRSFKHQFGYSPSSVVE